MTKRRSFGAEFKREAVRVLDSASRLISESAFLISSLDATRVYRVRGTLILSAGTGGEGGRWSDDFIERVLPAAERSQTLVKEVIF
jgi:hypothetical protein